MQELPHSRYERKLVVQRFSLPEVVALVQRHSGGFRQAYPERRVNNIYLDSPALGNYHDHVNGATHRVKTRLRWYGEAGATIQKPVLEHKFKSGALSGKLSYPLHPLVLNGAPLIKPLAQTFRDSDLPDAVRFNSRRLEPSLFNRYRRKYYVSADGRFRLTLDWELQFARLSASTATPGDWLGAGHMVVVEIKYSPADAERAASITNAFPFRVNRCSKYVLGIECSRLL